MRGIEQGDPVIDPGWFEYGIKDKRRGPIAYWRQVKPDPKPKPQPKQKLKT